MRDQGDRHGIVPIAPPDEFRTFGMDSMFPDGQDSQLHGQTYESVADRKLLLSWHSNPLEKAKLLHEGISEAGVRWAPAIAAGGPRTHAR